MARVLKEAQDNAQLWRGELTCTGAGWQQTGKPCGRLIEVLASDVEARGHTDMTGCRDTYYGFRCPACGCWTEIPSGDLPYDVKSMADKSRT